MHRLGFLPFYCFRRRGFFAPSSPPLSHPHSSSLAHYRSTPTPPLSQSCPYSACSAPQQGERGARGAQTQSPVCLFSLQYCCYLPSCLGFSTQRTFCFTGLCFTLQKAHLFLFNSFLFSVSTWLCGEKRLCMCVTAEQRGCRYQRLPAAATTVWALPVKRRR